MKQVWNGLAGWKTHIGCGLGTAAVLLGHFGNINFPGFEVNHHTWLQDVWTLGMISAIRHALSTRA